MAAAPPWLQSHHLTLMTVMWSVLVLTASALANADRRWLAAVSVVIALQYVTDAIDGKIGVLRNAGLVRWGYYMDHMLDYVFLCSILVGYVILLPVQSQYLMTAVIAVSGGFMVSSFLARSVTGVMRITLWRLGPLEIRLAFIGIDIWLATVGKAYMVVVVPYVIGVALCALIVLVFETQRALWRADCVERTRTAGAETTRTPLAEPDNPAILLDS